MTMEMKMDEKFEEGKKLGEERGEKRGEKRGERREKAEDVLDLLEEYGSIPQEVRTKVMEELELETLKKWHKLAAKVDSIDDFVKQM